VPRARYYRSAVPGGVPRARYSSGF
jgi:hypothetical protein